MQSWFTPLEWVLRSSVRLHNHIFSVGLPSNVQLLSISFYPYKICTPSSTHYLFSTCYPNLKLNTELPSPSWPCLQFPHYSVRVCDINGSLLTSACRDVWWHHNHLAGGKPRQSKRKAIHSCWFELPSDTNLNPSWLTAFMDTNNHHVPWTAPTGLSCGCKPQITSAKPAPGVSWWARRNEEQGTTWQAWSTWVWMTRQSLNEALWEEKIKQTKNPKLHDHVKIHVKISQCITAKRLG